MDQLTDKDVERVLGEPTAAEFSDSARRVRTNLLVASFIGGLVGCLGITIDPTSTFFGVKFSGLTDERIQLGLTIVIAYLLVHFLWHTAEAFGEWRLRITGTRVTFLTSVPYGSRPERDAPADPRQSTLYHWWVKEAKKIENISDLATRLERSIDELDQAMEANRRGGKHSSIDDAVRNLIQRKFQLTESIKAVANCLESRRIPVSLGRFDRWFHLFLRSQNLRWLVIDTGLPILISTLALYFLLR